MQTNTLKRMLVILWCYGSLDKTIFFICLIFAIYPPKNYQYQFTQFYLFPLLSSFQKASAVAIFFCK